MPFPSPDQQQRKVSIGERILDVVSAPSYASAGFTTALLNGENLWDGIVSGVRSHRTYGDVLRDYGVQDVAEELLGVKGGKVATGIAGFIGDVALDPTTYVGIGGATKSAKAAQVAKSAHMSAVLSGASPHVLAPLEVKAAATAAKVGEKKLISFAGLELGAGVEKTKLGRTVSAFADKVKELPLARQFRDSFVSPWKSAPIPLRAAGYAGKAEAVKVKQAIVHALITHQKDVEAIARKNNVPYDKLASVLYRAVEDPSQLNDALRAFDEAASHFGMPAFAPGEQQQLADAITEINLLNVGFLQNEIAAGVRPATSGLQGPLSYAKRMWTNEAKDVANSLDRRVGAMAGFEFNTTMAEKLQRDAFLADKTIDEINTLGRTGQLEFMGYKNVKKVFEDDPFVATYARARSSAEAVTGARFLKQATEAYGWTARSHVSPTAAQHGFTQLTQEADVIRAGWRKLNNRMATDLGLQNTYFEPEVARLLNSYHERVLSAGVVGRAYDVTMSAWKKMTLPIWPVYHVRNFMSDMWMLTMTDGGIPVHRLGRRVEEATRGFLAAREAHIGASLGTQAGVIAGKMNKEITLNGTKHDLVSIFQKAEESGLLDEGILRDLEDVVANPLKTHNKALKTVDGVIGVGMKVGEVRENWVRFTYFLDRLDRGDDLATAVVETKKRFFDYADLTDMERQIMRRVFPFYAWARHNIPRQAYEAMRRPAYLSYVQKARNEAGGEDGITGGALPPQFLGRGLPINNPLVTDKKTAGLVRLQGTIPAADLFQFENPVQMGLDMAAPIPKSITEVGINRDFFRNRPLERYKGESRNFLGLPVPNRILPLIENVRPLSELDRLNPGEVFGNAKHGPGWMPGELRITRPDTEPTQGVRASALVVPRTYPIDVGNQQKRAIASQRRRLAELKLMLKAASRRRDTASIIRIRQELMAIAQNPTKALYEE